MIAKKHKIIATGGTDYHGENRNVELASVDFKLDGFTSSRLGIKK